MAQAWKALERAQFEHFVEKERGRFTAWSARRIQEDEEQVERFPGRRRLVPGGVPGERRGGGHRLEEALRRGGAAPDIYILRGAAAEPFAQPLQQGGASGAAAAEDDGDSRRSRLQRAEDPSLEPNMWTRHSETPLIHPPIRRLVTGPLMPGGRFCVVHCLIGSMIPREAAVAIASGYPASACRATPIPGSQVSTRSSFSSASDVPSATTTMPACSE